MGRWAPNAQGRLEQAAMDLYAQRGFDDTTVADIAERAGLTERTFFRYYADKREVLFAGTAVLRDVLVREVQDARPEALPGEIVVAALEAVATSFFEDRRPFARRRHAIIQANVELQERELVKLAHLASAIADALRQRDVAASAAALAAEAGMAVFRVAFERWVSDPGSPTLAETIRASADELRIVVGGRKAAVR